MKKIDLSVKVAKSKWDGIFKNEKMTALGHIGTHFDVMNKEFPLENTKRCGKIVDVCSIRNRDIQIEDLRLVEINKHDFIIFYTGFLKEKSYGTRDYFKTHPQLSEELIQYLIDKQVSLIGIDAAGVRRGAEHTKTDQYCADNGIFIIENLDNLDTLLSEAGNKPFTVYTFPINFEGMTGLPCRVVAEV